MKKSITCVSAPLSQLNFGVLFFVTCLFLPQMFIAKSMMKTLDKEVEACMCTPNASHEQPVAENKEKMHESQSTEYSSAAAYIADLKNYVTLGKFSTFDKGLDLWDLWEEQGVHVTPVNYYSPIVSSDDLNEHYNLRKATAFNLHGLDMNDSLQYEILQELMTTFRDEVVSFPESLPGDLDPAHEASLMYYYKNAMFGVNDASLYHTVIRYFRPSQIIEVGSGASIKVSLAASSLNEIKANISVIEPFPNQPHNSHLSQAKGISRLIIKKVQDVSLNEFKALKANDILFLDSSHVVATGSDTVHEFLKILPVLAQGVIVHVHDVFLPNELPQHWLMGHDERGHKGWAEQYLLYAFLMYNKEFEVVASSSYINHKYMDEIREKMPERFTKGGGSFWFRRVLG